MIRKACHWQVFCPRSIHQARGGNVYMGNIMKGSELTRGTLERNPRLTRGVTESNCW